MQPCIWCESCLHVYIVNGVRLALQSIHLHSHADYNRPSSNISWCKFGFGVAPRDNTCAPEMQNLWGMCPRWAETVMSVKFGSWWVKVSIVTSGVLVCLCALSLYHVFNVVWWIQLMVNMKVDMARPLAITWHLWVWGLVKVEDDQDMLLYLDDLKAGGRININMFFTSIGIPMLKIRRYRDRLIFNMGIPYLRKS